jgi:catechol 2,3-dioxygenase-like lactoylglutathione lyase family enzyme
MTTPRLEDAVSLVPVRDIERTAEFYEQTLGFRVHFMRDDKSFAIIKREGAAIHFLRTDDSEVLRATANNIAIYIWVKGLDELYSQLEPHLSALPAGRVRRPFDQDYGVREFHVKDPDGCLLFFAEDLKRKQQG